MNVLLFGAPGSGKGTQSLMLVEQHGMDHISTGDLFRLAIKNNTSLGQEAKKYMDQGKLVPDAIVIGMVEEAFQDLQGRGFILDGFPRTVNQAESLEVMLENHSLSVDLAIFLDVPNELLLKRLTGRRVCRTCSSVFHVVTMPSKVSGVCDNCGGQLYQRDDDKEEVIGTRLDAYQSSTQPLKKYYENKDKLAVVDGRGSADEVFRRIESVLKS